MEEVVCAKDDGKCRKAANTGYTDTSLPLSNKGKFTNTGLENKDVHAKLDKETW